MTKTSLAARGRGAISIRSGASTLSIVPHGRLELRDSRFDAGGRVVMPPRSAPRALKVDRSRLPEPGDRRAVHLSRHRKVDAAERPAGVDGPARASAGRHVHAARPARRRQRSAGKEGLAAVTADMLDEGSGALSAIEMHEALARIGAQLDIDIGSDATLVEHHGAEPLRRSRRSRSGRHRRAAGAPRRRFHARAPAAAASADAAARHAGRGRRSRRSSGCSTATIRTATRRSAPSRRWRR